MLSYAGFLGLSVSKSAFQVIIGSQEENAFRPARGPPSPPGKQVRLGREPTALQDPLGASGPVEIASLLGTSELKHG